MTNKNHETDQDAINAELFGNDQKTYEDWSCDSYVKQLNVEPHEYVNVSGKVNPNKPVKYTPNSNPKMSIYIPLKYDYRARKLLNLALESDTMEQFKEKVSLWPSLNKIQIPEEVTDFIRFDLNLLEGKKVEYSFKLWSKAYLKACLYMSQDDLSKNNILNGFSVQESGLERLEKIKNTENIKRTLESL